MLVLDIINDISDVTSNQYIILKFTNNYDHNIFDETNPIITNVIKKGEILEIKAKICKYLGEGSYGTVYKIKINNTYYALKMNDNEVSDKLFNRYESIISIEKIRKYIIDIHICGKIKHEKYSYFSIMEFGGKTLKSIIPISSVSTLVIILKQLFNIVHICTKFKILLTDFKLSNITISHDNRLKLIDLYMDCKSYTPCKECRIVKTYSTIEIEKVKGIYEDEEYNFTYIYIPLAIGLIDLICKDSASHYFTKLGSKFNINQNIKQMIPLIQLSCFNYSNDSNSPIRNYKHIYNYKKKMESKYPIIKNSDFYEYFMNMIEPRDEYKEFISKKKLLLILNDLFSVDPSQRSLDFLKNKLI